MNKTSDTLWSRFSQFAAWCAQQFLDAVAAISGFYYSHKYAAIARRLGYSQAVQRAPKRGFIIIQIDGLSHQHLLEAMAEGDAPHLTKMVRRGWGKLMRWRCGLPSTTPASQAGIMFGSNYDIPAFRWYEKETQVSTVCKLPGVVRSLQDRISQGRQGILQGGASYVNLFDGGAASSLFTMSGMNSVRLFEGVRGVGLLVLFALNPFRSTRVVALSIWEYFVSSFQSLKDRLTPGTPAPSQRFFTLLRILDNVIFRELQTFVVMLDIYKGLPSIYTTYYAYDELAHQYGPRSKPAMRSLHGIDKRIRQIDRLRRAGLGRKYDLYILSDHGMTSAIPFTKAYGESLGEFVARLPKEGVEVSEQWGHEQQSSHEAQYLLEELQSIEENLAEPLARIARRTRRLISRRIVSDFDQELPDWDLLRRSDVVVRSSGSLAHLYFNVTSRQMDVSEIASLYADLMVKLTTHSGIWLVVGREGEDVVIASARGILTLDDQQQIVEGENPLGILPEPEIAAAQIRRLAHFPHSGDLILLGEYALETEEVICFEQQWACHGGLGGPQDYPFMICPSGIEMDLEDVTNSEQLHDHFVRNYLREELVPSELQLERRGSPRP